MSSAAVEGAPACSGGLTGGEGAAEGATGALDSLLQRACDILVRAIWASRLHGATNEASVSAASTAHPQPARGGVGGSPLLAAAAVTPRTRPSKHADLAGVVLTFAPPAAVSSTDASHSHGMAKGAAEGRAAAAAGGAAG